MSRLAPGFIASCSAAFILAVSAGPSEAGKADVTGVKVVAEGGGAFRFEVTIRSDDRGWDKYADKWEVVGPGGKSLGIRVLLHPHEDEQPFTRDLGGVVIPADVGEVTVRAHDKVEGWGGAEVTVKIPR
jgi:hypothetical protein